MSVMRTKSMLDNTSQPATKTRHPVTAAIAVVHRFRFCVGGTASGDCGCVLG
jgi:hypothetical protein